MPERNAERKIHVRKGEDLYKRFRIRCSEIDTTIQHYVVDLLERELSGDTPRRGAKCRASSGRR